MIVSPVLLLIVALALALADLAFLLLGRRRRPVDTLAGYRPPRASSSPTGTAATCSPSTFPPLIEALSGNPANEIVVVDNGSEDGSAEFLHEHFPAGAGGGAA